MNIVLIGMMGSGKSSVGKRAAQKLKWDFFDVDQLIEKERKKTVARIFEEEGEDAFRRYETEMIERVSNFDRCIVSTGGGAPCREENWKAISRNSRVVWLKSKPETLLERLKKSRPGTRPLMKDMTLERIQTLLQQREPFYARAPLSLETDGLSVPQAVEKLLALAQVQEPA